ncbi:MAG TPA: ABC transporter ATP-binding protein [Candidatus Limnocylindrales bacterium]|nr:ABC transporter ATP-binding protein [Candidatus Limnocylindrales bacterium]
MTRDAVISVEALTKRYGSVEAVRGIDFDVRRGEVLGFLGPNGAGKSTTIRCLLDLIRPSGGNVRMFGLDPRHDGVAIRSRVGYVPGELRLPDRMTGRQLVAAVSIDRGPVDPDRLAALAERLAVDLGRQNRQLSTGNRRKLALLLAFLWPVELLILDEPTNGLDPLMQQTFLGMVAEARAAGATVLLSSHVLSEVQRSADRVVVLRAGRIAAEGPIEELRRRARQRLEVWFAGPAPAQRLAGLEELEDVRVDGRRVNATIRGSVRPVLRLLADEPVENVLIEEPDLEEAFLDLYGAAS